VISSSYGTWWLFCCWTWVGNYHNSQCHFLGWYVCKYVESVLNDLNVPMRVFFESISWLLLNLDGLLLYSLCHQHLLVIRPCLFPYQSNKDVKNKARNYGKFLTFFLDFFWEIFQDFSLSVVAPCLRKSTSKNSSFWWSVFFWNEMWYRELGDDVYRTTPIKDNFLCFQWAVILCRNLFQVDVEVVYALPVSLSKNGL